MLSWLEYTAIDTMKHVSSIQVSNKENVEYNYLAPVSSDGRPRTSLNRRPLCLFLFGSKIIPLSKKRRIYGSSATYPNCAIRSWLKCRIQSQDHEVPRATMATSLLESDHLKMRRRPILRRRGSVKINYLVREDSRSYFDNHNAIEERR